MQLSYFAAALSVCMTAWQMGCREGVLDSLLEDELYIAMPLPVALESLSKVTSEKLLAAFDTLPASENRH